MASSSQESTEMAEFHGGEKAHDSHNENMVERLEHFQPGYGEDRDSKVREDIHDEENPNVYHQMNAQLALALAAMSFLWVGSQIPLYLYGSVLPLIYSDIGGGGGRYLWMVIGYLIPNAALCPFVGSLSDLFGRKWVAIGGQVLLIIGPIIVATADQINTAIGGMVISGLGAGLNELIALAGTSEMVPIKKRGMYVGLVVFTILPFCPSALWAQLISKDGSWRYVGALICAWNFVGLVLVFFFYKDPARNVPRRPAKQVLAEIDWVGGALSTLGVTTLMMGMQWGANQYAWSSTHVLAPFIIGIILICLFFVWEVFFAKFPMAPKELFSRDKRTMACILLITFFSGGNFFVMLLFWPTQAYNMYGSDPVGSGVRTLPIGFGIIGGAVISLLLIGVTKGRTTILLVFWTALMTAFVGAMSIARVDNINTVYAILTLASMGVGAVIIPCSIVAQIVAPVDLIGTVTAITLSIRYIGGAIGFTVYYNIFYHKFNKLATGVGAEVLEKGICYDLPTLVKLVTLGAESQYENMKHLIATSPKILHKDIAFSYTIQELQIAFAKAYQWPYWISIAFGGVCVICAFGLRDIRKFM